MKTHCHQEQFNIISIIKRKLNKILLLILLCRLACWVKKISCIALHKIIVSTFTSRWRVCHIIPPLHTSVRSKSQFFINYNTVSMNNDSLLCRFHHWTWMSFSFQNKGESTTATIMNINYWATKNHCLLSLILFSLVMVFFIIQSF
jgi:hypothetical protein